MTQRPDLEGVGGNLLKLSVLAAPLACLIGAFFLTAGTDETWILHGVRGLAHGGRYGSASPYVTVYSTGGLFTAVATVLEALGGGRLLIVRLLSILSLAALVALLIRRTPSILGGDGTPAERWIAAVPILGVHGTFLIGSQAYGEILATTLLFAGAFLWASRPAGTWSRRLAVGALFGLAAAARLNLVVGLAAIPAAAFVFSRTRREIVDALIAAATGAVVFAIQWKGLQLLSVDVREVEQSAGNYGLSGGVGSLGYFIPQRLGYFAIAQDFMPLVLLVALTAAWVVTRSRVANPRTPDLLVAFGWILWFSWLGRSPIPHLRYLWPALAAFAYVGGLVLALVYRGLGVSPQPAVRLAVLVVGLACGASGYVEASRNMLAGNSDILSWEWQRGCPQSLQYGPFKQLRAQRDLVRKLQELPPDQGVASIGFDTALAYLSRRQILPLDAYYEERVPSLAGAVRSAGLPLGTFPRWLVLTPIINRHRGCQMSPQLHQWIESNCALRERYTGYLLYEVTGRLPEKPELLRFNEWEPRLPLAGDESAPAERKKS